MIIGVPNSGKSSIINKRKQSVNIKTGIARVGPLPGVTRQVQGFSVQGTFLMDTPGILVPSFSDRHIALKLVLTGAIRDKIAGNDVIADFLLYRLNKTQNFKYLELAGLSEPTNNVDEVLKCIAKRIGALQAGNRYDEEAAAVYFITKYRKGEFGGMTLDDVDEVITPIPKIKD